MTPAPNELVARVTGHLGCDLSEIVPVTERFPIWDHVNVQRGVNAYLAAPRQHRHLVRRHRTSAIGRAKGCCP